MSGSTLTARARLTRWRMPPDNSCGWWPSNPASPTSEMMPRALRSDRARGSPRSSLPKVTLRSTVRHGNSESFWNTKPRSGPGPVNGLPDSRIRPPLGVSRPWTMRRNVVLPQPLGPTMTKNSPARTSKLMRSSTRREPSRR
jgi:hypothetical protein